MMRIGKAVLATVFLLIFQSACQNENTLVPLSSSEFSDELAMIKQDIDDHILATVNSTKRPFDWNTQDNSLLFNALMVSDQTLAIGYNGGELSRDAILNTICLSESIHDDERRNDILIYEDNVLNFFMVRINELKTLEAIRTHPNTSFVEISNYPFDIHQFVQEQPIGSPGPLSKTTSFPSQRNMVLDPQNNDPGYPDQVGAFDGGLRTVIRRHNMESAYVEHGVFGDGIDVAIVDNGILPNRLEFFENNGYGERYKTGYYNPLWFFPFTSPDGWQPQITDVFGISFLIYDTYYVHGSEMMKQVLTLSPNANIHSVRGSTWTVIVLIDQMIGISNALRAMADDPNVRVTSMSMGTIIYSHRIKNAIEYYYSKGKIMIASAGSTFAVISDLLGVLFPGILPETVTTTGIPNREITGGEFELSEGSHGGPENDFTVENTGSSSVSASRTAGMISLIWSANPDLTREEVMDILIASSHFYQTLGEKHPLFGWGTIDVGYAVELALAE